MATILSSSLSDNQAECPYLESLGLRHSPFTQDDQSLAFLDERGAQHLNLAIHLLESSHMIVIVLGNTGMGKSTIARQLKFKLPDTILPCLISAKNLTPQSLLRSMAGRLGIPQDVDLPTQRLLLAENTVSLRHQDSVPLIIIDDAHLLDDATLEALSQIHTGADQEYNRWELALFSGYGLEKRIAAQLPTGKENIYEIQLKPYNAEQTRDYLTHRLKTAGWSSDDLPFTDRQFKLLFEKSGGVPAQINQAAHEMLCNRNRTTNISHTPESDKAAPVQKKQYPAVKLQRILLILAIILVSGVLLFQDEINQLFVDKNDLPDHSTPAPVSPAPDRATPGEHKSAIAKKAQTPRPATKTQPTQMPATKNPRQKSDPAVMAASPFVTIQKTDIPRLTLPKAEQQDMATATQKPQKLQQSSEKVPTVASSKKPETPTVTNLTDKAPVKALPKREHSADARAGHDWIMARNPDHYTLQLLATAEEAQIQRYIKQFELQGRSYYYPIHFRNRLLYVLLTGDYPDRASGKAAMEQLPPGIRKDKPWLRALSLIQAEIKRGHK